MSSISIIHKLLLMSDSPGCVQNLCLLCHTQQWSLCHYLEGKKREIKNTMARIIYIIGAGLLFTDDSELTQYEGDQKINALLHDSSFKGCSASIHAMLLSLPGATGGTFWEPDPLDTLGKFSFLHIHFHGKLGSWVTFSLKSYFSNECSISCNASEKPLLHLLILFV